MAKNLTTLGIFCFMAAQASIGGTAWAGLTGGDSAGGGDRCEERFKAVAADLSSWLGAGGAQGLILTQPHGASLSVDTYVPGMLAQLGNFHVTCVSAGETGFPVVVGGQAKECRSFHDDKGVGQVICDRDKFYAQLPSPDNDSSQYQIVHHEFATMAGFEVPNDGDSQYWISDQITGFLESRIVKKLVVNPDTAGKAHIGSITLEGQEDISTAVTADRKRLAYSDGKNNVKILDLVSFRELATAYQSPTPTGYPPRLRFSSDGALLLVGDSFIVNTAVGFTVLDARTGAKKYQLANQFFATFTPDGQRLVALTAGGALGVYDAQSGKALQKFKVPQLLRYGKIEGVGEISPDGTKLILSTRDDATHNENAHLTDHLVDLKTGQLKFSRSGPYGESPSYGFSADGTKMIVRSKHGADGAIDQLDVETGKVVGGLSYMGSFPESIRWLADGRMIEKFFTQSCTATVSNLADRLPFFDLACSRSSGLDTDPNGTVLLGVVGTGDVVASSLQNGSLLGVIWSKAGDDHVTLIDRESRVLSADRALIVSSHYTASPSPGALQVSVTIRVVEIPTL